MGRLYRANADGSNARELLNSFQYGYFTDVKFDWPTGNLYAATATNAGYVLVCNSDELPLTCSAIVEDFDNANNGIALNGNEGAIFWTSYNTGSINRADLDGSNAMTIVTGEDNPKGIVIDADASRLYWTAFGAGTIRSSGLNGEEVKTVVQLPSERAQPWGLALLESRIIWSNYGSRSLQSSNKTGGDVRALFEGLTASPQHLSVVTEGGSASCFQ